MSLDIHTDPLGHDVEYVDVKKGAIEADVPNRVYNIWAGQYLSPTTVEQSDKSTLNSNGMAGPHDDKLDMQHYPFRHRIRHRRPNDVNLFNASHLLFTALSPYTEICGRVIVTIGQSLLMASLAEMCSIWPYAGGQQ